MTEVLDMSRYIEAKSDQLNADDLIGKPRTITVTRVTGNDGDQPVSIFYEGDNGKPFKPCKTIRRVLMAVWGPYANEYVGRSMTLYRDDRVQFGGLEVGGIRISHMSGIDKETTVVVMKSKGKKAGMKILPLVVQSQQAEPTLEDARDALDAATTLEDLQAAWKKRWMAPFRDELASVLDQRKAALAGEGRPDTDRGEGHNLSADELIDHIARKTTVIDVNSLVGSWASAIAEMTEEDRARIADAQRIRIAEIKG